MAAPILREGDFHEQWRLVVGNPDYEVSDLGRVRRATEAKNTAVGRLLKPQLNHGYPCVTLCGPGTKRRLRATHRLVAEAFLPRVPGCTYVNHINAVKADSRLSNLEWVTQRQNLLEARRMGLFPAFERRGAKNGNSKLTEAQVLELRALNKKGVSGAELGRRYGITTSNACDIINRRTWPHL